MKKLIFYSLLFVTVSSQAQIIDFEDLNLPADSVLNGSEGASLYSHTYADFPVTWNDAWGFWAAGWAISTMTDTTVSGTDGMFNSRSGKGSSNTPTYLIGQQGSIIRLKTGAEELEGFFLNNCNYAYYSMQDGDNFAKKFGGAGGIDPDFFSLTVYGYRNGQRSDDSVVTYLADFRFTDDSRDYLVKDWIWVDLSEWSAADSLEFILNSSDTGEFGINTPTFFAIDELTLRDRTSVRETLTSQVQVYPNPASRVAYLSGLPENEGWNLLDIQGRSIRSGNGNQIDLQGLDAGIYLIQSAGLSLRLAVQP